MIFIFNSRRRLLSGRVSLDGLRAVLAGTHFERSCCFHL